MRRAVGLIARALPLLLLPALLAAAAHGQTSGLTPLKAVILGDSYSAGNGAGDYYGPTDASARARTGAEKYADWLRTQGYAAIVTNRACSGSKSTHIYRERIYTDFSTKVAELVWRLRDRSRLERRVEKPRVLRVERPRREVPLQHQERVLRLRARRDLRELHL